MIIKALPIYIAALGTLLALIVSHQTQVPGNRLIFFVANAAVAAYLMFEVSRVKHARPTSWLVDPAVLASLFTFGLGIVLTNAIYLAPDDALAVYGLTRDISDAMVHYMALVLLGALCMWLGYWSTIGSAIAVRLCRVRLFTRFVRTQGDIRTLTFIAIYSISLGVRIVAVNLGIYGYSADFDRLLETTAYREYISFGDSAGRLCLLVISLAYFSRRSTATLVLLCIVFLAELFLGVLSGFKSAVVYPFLLIGICYYVARRRVPLFIVAPLIASIAFAYVVIEPYRELRSGDELFRARSIEAISDAIISSSGEKRDWHPADIALAFVARTNLTYIASKGLEYADEEAIDDDAPAFLEDIFLAPLHAAIPRFLWSDKPQQNLGLWYYRQVLGIPGTTAVGMSPFTYLYFAGGALAVALGFFMVGILQRASMDYFFGLGAGGIIVFLGTLNYLVSIDSAFNTIILNLVRYIPFLFLFQFAVYRR